MGERRLAIRRDLAHSSAGLWLWVVPLEALAAVIAVFFRFWQSEWLIVRRLRAMAVLDPELAGVFRDERRRQLLEVIAGRFPEAAGWSAPTLRTKVDPLHMITSFASYDSVAERRGGEDAVPVLLRLARLALLIEEA